MARVFNFSAGPAMLPEPVLRQAQEEMLDWHGTGMSVAEMSHRGKDFAGIAARAESDLRELLDIPDNYRVLFLQGGAALQFSAVPMNLLRGGGEADYICTGTWSKKAIAEARRYCTVNVVATTEDGGFVRAPAQSELRLTDQASYLHYTANETIHGVEFPYVPRSGNVPLISDMSSTILSRPIDVSRYGLIYAGAQKNIGPAGLTLVIVREDLIGKPITATPTLLDYKIHADNGSMYNTPPTYAWYLAGLVFQWLKAQGGMQAMGEINARKSRLLYEAIDASGFYRNPVEPESRSWMNVRFDLTSPDLNDLFLQEAQAAGLSGLKGHRLLGGMRASIYNAMPETGVQALIDFMREFERVHG